MPGGSKGGIVLAGVEAAMKCRWEIEIGEDGADSISGANDGADSI